MKMYRTIDLFSFGMACVASQRFVSRKITFFEFVLQSLLLFENYLYLFDNIWYILPIFGTFLLSKPCDSVCPWLDLPTPQAAQKLGSVERLEELLQQHGLSAERIWKIEVERMFA